jgi:ABC-type enterochelin transport system substrate-binding protein
LISFRFSFECVNFDKEQWKKLTADVVAATAAAVAVAAEEAGAIAAGADEAGADEAAADEAATAGVAATAEVEAAPEAAIIYMYHIISVFDNLKVKFGARGKNLERTSSGSKS